MTSGNGIDFEREHRLIEQLEFRIATADTDTKFEAILARFLPALILKLASENTRNRDLTIKICQHISQRVKLSSSIQLPIAGLLKNFRETSNAFVRRFSLLFIQQGFGRVDLSKSMELLPDVLQFAIPQPTQSGAAITTMWSIAFDFLLNGLRYWKPAERGSEADVRFAKTFALTEQQCNVLTAELCQFLLYDPKIPSSATQLSEDFRLVYEKHFRQRTQVAPRVGDFFFTAIFTDEQRLIPATIMAVDANAVVSGTADIMFKQCTFDLESQYSVDALFTLYQSARPRLRTKILSLLSRSKLSTCQNDRVFSIIEEQLRNADGGLEASKLRAALFNYLSWTVRVSDNLESISLSTQRLLKDYIDSQGWPTTRDRTSVDAELRCKAYESIGLLTSRQRNAEPNIDLIIWLFTSLRCDTTSGVRPSIEEALARVMNFTVLPDASSEQQLSEFLLWNATAEVGSEDPIYYFATVNNTKYIATRFANKCLHFNNTTARLIDILAVASTDRRELSEEGLRGLDPYWHLSNSKLTGSARINQTIEFPDTPDLILTLFKEPLYHKTSTIVPEVYITAAVSFCWSVLVTQALESPAPVITESGTWKIRIRALVEYERSVRSRIKERLKLLEKEAVSQLLQQSINGMNLGSLETADISVALLSLINNDSVSDVAASLLDPCLAGLTQAQVQSQAARCFGILASLSPKIYEIIEKELIQCLHWNTTVGSGAVTLRGHLLAATYCIARSSLRGNANSVQASARRLLSLLKDIVIETHDTALLNAAFHCVYQMSLCLDPATNFELGSSDLLEKLLTECKRENDSAVAGLGGIIGHEMAHWDLSHLKHVLDRAFSLHEVKKAEFHFALGESFAVAAAGFKSTSLTPEFDVEAPMPAWGYHEEFLTELLDRILVNCKSTKPALKKATGIWLLSVVQFCGELSPVQARLRELQQGFARLLNDRDEIVQETGSRGLGMVYEKGDRSLKDDLVRDLVQSFTSSSAKLSGNVDEDTQLFEAGALPTEGGQSVTTYKDIVSLATEMGDPSLVYKFMNLASNNAIWTSRAAFGRAGLSSILADSSYLAENKKFYPKLFRYRFDPNPNVRRSMNDIWRALVKDPGTVIDEHFDLIMEDLLKSALSGREWRAREASCAAITDLIQGRDVDKFEKFLDEIWTVAFKVLDDVKESVRVAAMKLCRSLTSMLIQNLEVGQGTTKRATTMLGHAMPFLLKQMEGGSAQEVQQYATISLLEIVKKSPPKSLLSFAPAVLETLVNSLSTLEHESVNYLHLNADKYGLTAEKLDQMRVSSVNASPVTEAIDVCLESVATSSAANRNGDTAMGGVEERGDNPMADAMSRLEGTFKTAIGLPSKVGLSRVIVTLVVRHHAAFRPYADKFAQLIRKHLLDRNATISIAFSTSLGYLMRLSSEKEILATNKYAQKLYFGSQELSQRATAGDILQAISRTSNDVFLQYATVFLPFAFVGRNDPDEDVRGRFEPAWKDNIGGSRAIQLYLKEIADLVRFHIKSSLWPIKHACCFAVADMIKSMDSQGLYDEAEARLLLILIDEALGGKTWDGKEKVVSALPLFVKNAQRLWTDAQVSAQLQKLVLRESKRTSETYRPAAMEALSEFVELRPDLDLSPELVDYFRSLVEELTDKDAMVVDHTNGVETKSLSAFARELTLKAIASCTFKMLPTDAKSDVLEPAIQIARKLHSAESANVDMALFNSAASFFSRLANTSTIEGGRRAANQRDKEIAAGRNEAFDAVVALLGEDFSRPQVFSEDRRKSRISLLGALADSQAGSSTARARFRSLLDNLLVERSRPLREEITRIRDKVRESD